MIQSPNIPDAPGASATKEPPVDLAVVDAIIDRVGRRPEDLIPLLQAIQKEFNYLPRTALERLCERTDIPPEAASGVSTFYSQFRHQPVGRHVIKTCVGTACHVSGARTLHDEFKSCLKLRNGKSTTEDGMFTLEEVACLGCCMLAPVAQIDDVIYGPVNVRAIPDLLEDFLACVDGEEIDETEEAIHGPATAGEARMCLCSSCVAGGSRPVYEELKRQTKALGLPVRVKTVGCRGLSFQTPLVEIAVHGRRRYRYGRVDVESVRDLLLEHFKPASWLQRVRAGVFHVLEGFFTDESIEPPARYSSGVRSTAPAQFERSQVRLATEHAGKLDPHSIQDYIDHDGFQALVDCLKHRRREDLIGEITKSGLRGRGGAGFSTGLKWKFTAESPGPVKYVICNGDEGDPGAFMDRMILESFPYRVLEGMALAAYAIGASEGFLYIRAEYPLATHRIRHAIEQCVKSGYLGDAILGTDFSLHLKVVEGAGAFVCGEETALMSAIEGGRGMPRMRPPFPAQSGLWGKPTLINNVETLALVPWILRNGADRFAAYGTEKSKGTKTFALAGKVANGGLIEIPMGMTIREIVEEIGGGIKDGRRLKAVLMGGPSGGCVPASLAHTPVDYERLVSVGAIMGSGGMVVLDESDCMVDIARYFMTFLRDESCGKCTPCRVGTWRMGEILDRLCEGRGRKGDLEKLETLAEITRQGSLCGLGKTAPNPVQSCLRYFRHEFEAHLQGRCPAGRCKALIQYAVTDDCIGCTRCAQHCPADAIPMDPFHKHEIEEPLCTRCDICRQVCPVDAIEIRSPLEPSIAETNRDPSRDKRPIAATP